MNTRSVNPSFPCKVIIFNIKNALHGLRDFQKRLPYEATRKYWDIMGEHRNNNIYKFAVGLVDGVAKTAYRINKWFPTLEEQYIGRYEFEGSETEETKELIGFSFYKQRSLCMEHWKFGGYLVVEFDGKGKFIMLKGQQNSQWTKC